MSTKIVNYDEIGDIVISKRKGQRAIRVTINSNRVKVTQPSWLPFSAGEKFIAERLDWIKEHVKPLDVLLEGSPFGLMHTLHFQRADACVHIIQDQIEHELRVRRSGRQLPHQLNQKISIVGSH